MIKTPRICIIGPGGCGKDTVAEMIHKHSGLSFTASSWACRDYVFARLADEGVHFENADIAHERRRDYREQWKKYIHEFCQSDQARLARLIYTQSNIYVGPRSRREFDAAVEADLHRFCIWVDRVEIKHVKADNGTVVPYRQVFLNDTTLELTEADCHISIINNGTLEELEEKVKRFCELIRV